MRHELVLRRDPGGYIGQSDRTIECDLLRAAGAAGVPVPTVRFLLEPEDELGVRLRHGPHRRRDDPPQDPARRRVRVDARPGSRIECGEIAARHPRRATSRRSPKLPVQGRDRADRAVPLDPRRLRRAAPRVRARPAVARSRDAARSQDGRAATRARRLPQRQLHRRPGGTPLGARLGARAPRRPDRGSRLAVREVVAVRQRRPAASAASARSTQLLDGYAAAGGGDVGERAPAVLGGVRHA